MAEGPQVRLRAEWLQRELAGRAIERAESPRADLSGLAQRLRGRTVVRAFARGKNLLLELSGGLFLHNHLRMQGRWRRLGSADAAAPRGAWLVLRLADRALANLHGQTLALLDEAGVQTLVEGLGVDVMGEPFPEQELLHALAAAPGEVGPALLDQRRVCGIGNIARSEALYLAGVHPARSAGGLSQEELRAVAAAVASVTRESYAAGGRWSRRVYQRAGEPCPRCATTIELLRRGSPPRDAFLCPRCQPAGPSLLVDPARRGGRRGTLRIGLAVWAHAPWVGSFYPPGARPRDFLRLYAQRLPAVEGNTTFHAVPSTATLERWKAETPPGFRLCPKLPREITHQGRLLDRCGEALAFLGHMRALGERLGPVLAQLPPDLGPRRADELAGFLDAWPSERSAVCVEVRDPAWLELGALERLDTLLAEHGAGRAILDSRPIHEGGAGALPPDLRRKPDLPVLPTAPGPVAMVRFIAHPDPGRSRRWMREWIAPLSRWLQEGRDVYVFVHCPREERAPGLARELHTLLAGAGLLREPLPWTRDEPDDGSGRQLQLFS
jgi:uncharacterized protein YecE (DUF72 family)/formamidopyrimidine-DNA glycosylase